jgi:hypothetical protein
MTSTRALPKMAGHVEFDPVYNTILLAEEAEHPVNGF